MTEMTEPDETTESAEPVDSSDHGTGQSANSPSRGLQFLLVLAVLLVAVGVAAALRAARETPQPRAKPRLGPLVETVTTEITDLHVVLRGQGEVTPRRSVDLLPEVPGKVVSVHPNLRSGGRFAAGEVLVRIDPRDYELAVERARAAVARARTQLEREQAEARAATAEWRDMHGDDPPPDLLVRGPQIRQATAELAAAEADLRTAELALERTALSVPFAGLVLSENVDPGQYVTAGRVLASVIGTDAVEIRVPFDDEELAWVDLPGTGGGASSAAPATVRARVAGAEHTWPAVLERLEGQVDPKSRMVHLVIRVDRPFDPPRSGPVDGRGDALGAPGRPPLLPGIFASVDLEGRIVERVTELPRYAIHRRGEEPVAWTVDDGSLRMAPVTVVRADRDSAFVRGLEVGTEVIVSALDLATDGMAVRVAGSESGSGSSAEAPATREDTP